MATALSDAALNELEVKMTNMETQINSWEQPIIAIRTKLSGDTGIAFATGSKKGEKARTAMKTIVDTLDAQKSSMRELIANTRTFIAQQRNANNS